MMYFYRTYRSNQSHASMMMMMIIILFIRRGACGWSRSTPFNQLTQRASNGAITLVSSSSSSSFSMGRRSLTKTSIIPWRALHSSTITQKSFANENVKQRDLSLKHRSPESVLGKNGYSPLPFKSYPSTLLRRPAHIQRDDDCDVWCIAAIERLKDTTEMLLLAVVSQFKT
jgi:hypothetical protein